jgi:hypothetical protein
LVESKAPNRNSIALGKMAAKLPKNYAIMRPSPP